MKKRYKNMPAAREKQILDTLAGWTRAGVTQKEMAERLNQAGEKTVYGLDWTHHTVSNFMRVRRRAVTNRLAEGPTQGPRRATVARATIEAILTEPALDDKQRVVVLSALMGA